MWLRCTKPFRKLWLKMLLFFAKLIAKSRHKRTGVTQYVIVTGWHSVRVMSKDKYEYIRKYIKKKFGKDLRRNVMYRADGTLIRNPWYVSPKDK